MAAAAEIYTSLDDVNHVIDSAITVGFFDGVHIGHRRLLKTLLDMAERRRLRPTVVTFHRSPRTILTGQHIPLLTTTAEKALIMRNMGIRSVIVAGFDADFAQLSPRSFVEQVLQSRIGMKGMVTGYDHRFGQGGTGDVELLRELSRDESFLLEVVEEQRGHNTAYSSSRIRELIGENGDVNRAASMLTRCHAVRGTVVGGDGRGRQLGYPTANLTLLHPEKLLPARGVYAVKVRVNEEHDLYEGMMNIGVRPTVTEGTREVAEVHLLSFTGDLYGHDLTVYFVHRLRPEKNFNSVSDLVEQLDNDRERCISVLESLSFQNSAFWEVPRS